MRVIVGIMVLAAVIGFGWVSSLPDKQECVASGRVVDPTERHCVATSGYQQLQEHALFHSREAILAGGLVLAIAYGTIWHRRRKGTLP